ASSSLAVKRSPKGFFGDLANWSDFEVPEPTIAMRSAEAGERLETPKQLASRVGVSERKIRYLIQNGQLEHVMIGCRVHVPVGAFARFLNQNTVTPCQDATKDRDFVGSPSASASTSPGPNRAAAASARLARQIANGLKSSLRNGSNTEDAEPAP